MTMELTRRTLLARLRLGLGGGALASLLSACGPGATVAPTAAPAAQSTSVPKPAAPTSVAATVAATATPATASRARGSGGALKVLMWQGPTILNPHFAQG